MKRRITVRCAAANDEEDLGGLFGDEAAPRKARRADAEGASTEGDGPNTTPAESGAPEGSATKRKKEKEFAWMDSEEEEEEEENEIRRCKGDDAERREGDGSEEENIEVSASSLDQAQSFGRVMRLAPALKRRLRRGDMTPEDIAAACRALTRTKFFDNEILSELQRALRRLLSADKLGIAHATDAIECLWALNAYDSSVFGAVAKSFTPKVATLEPGIRNAWKEAFRSSGHDHDKGFVQMLEVPPLPSVSPNFRKIRCEFFAKGCCALDSSCTYSHDPRAPLALNLETSFVRSSPVMMTQCQYSMGGGTYGGVRRGGPPLARGPIG